jgi:hypothetical protein
VNRRRHDRVVNALLSPTRRAGGGCAPGEGASPLGPAGTPYRTIPLNDHLSRRTFPPRAGRGGGGEHLGRGSSSASAASGNLTNRASTTPRIGRGSGRRRARVNQSANRQVRVLDNNDVLLGCAKPGVMLNCPGLTDTGPAAGRVRSAPGGAPTRRAPAGRRASVQAGVPPCNSHGKRCVGDRLRSTKDLRKYGMSVTRIRLAP